MWLVDIFRAQIVDISEHSLTIEVTLYDFLAHSFTFFAVYPEVFLCVI